MASKKSKRAKVSKPTPAVQQKQQTLEDLVRMAVGVQRNLHADGIGIRMHIESGPLESLRLEHVPEDASGARFTKVSSMGKALPASATDWEGVYDATTGLIWGRRLLSGERAWTEAIKAAGDAKLCGAPARAPTIQERLSIIDHSRVSPALDVAYFDEKEQNGWEWTSTPYASSPSDYAWDVDLGSGGSDWDGRSDRNHVRAVRAGQPIGI